MSNAPRGPTTLASIGEVRAREASIPFSITSVPLVFRSLVTSACWKRTGAASATPGVARTISITPDRSEIGPFMA